jgi:hypothetical protein
MGVALVSGGKYDPEQTARNGQSFAQSGAF